MRRLLLVLALALSALAVPAMAGGAGASGLARDTSRDFQLPSGNIGCAVDPAPNTDGLPLLHCSVGSGVSDRRWVAARCRSAGLWQATLHPELRAGQACGPELAFDPARARVLAYGASTRIDGMTCSASSAGLSCFNRNGSGFELSRARQVFFERPTTAWAPNLVAGDWPSFSVRIGAVETAECTLAATSDFTFARCDGDLVPRPPRPAGQDCDIAGLDLGAKGKGQVACATDTVRLGDNKAPLLPVGRIVTAGPFRCSASATTFSCTRADGHGFAWTAGHRWRVF